jgi:RNA polymerase sigma-70 factor, ECF subfamily
MTTATGFPACVTAFETELDVVYRALRRQGIAGADAEDLAQEVFLVMWRRWADYDSGRPLRPWILGITFRVAHDHRRRRRREVPSGLIDPAPDDHTSVDEQVALARARALVRQALGTLSDNQRAVMILHELDGLAMPEIAGTLEVPVTTLYSRLASARRSFARAVRRLERAPALARPRAAVPALAAAPSLESASLESALLELERLPDAPAPALRARILDRARSAATAGPPAAAAGPRAVPAPLRLPLPLAAAGGAAVLAAAVWLLWPAARGHDVRAASGAFAAEGTATRPSRAAALASVAPRRLATLLPPATDAEPAASADLRRGLIGYWRFDDGYGSSAARDGSGHGTDCQLRGLDPTADWVDGRMGGALNLTGRGWLECPDPRFGRGPDLTVAAWVKRPDGQRGMRVLATRQLGAGARDHFFFGVVGDELAISSHVWNGPLRHAWPTGDERWVHVAAVHRDGNVRLFIDGVQVAERASYRGRTVDTGAPLIIGAGVNGPDPAVTTQHLRAAVDELLVYDRPLSNGEVAALAGGIQPRVAP